MSAPWLVVHVLEQHEGAYPDHDYDGRPDYDYNGRPDYGEPRTGPVFVLCRQREWALAGLVWQFRLPLDG